MKIEMGESLIYSWLRHEKQCQLTQINWKLSQYWERTNYDELQVLMKAFEQHYQEKYSYDIFKGCSLEQLLKQAEIDAIGISFSQTAQSIYAVDIAYHESGLNYGDKEKTICKIIQKCIRTILCLYGYFNIITGEVIFASPKINNAIEKELIPMFEELTQLFKHFGLQFIASLYCNNKFFSGIMQPVLTKGNNIADTSELFLRSMQMYQMFAEPHPLPGEQLSLTKVITSKRNVQDINNNSFSKAINKIPKWAASPEQANYKIIRAYFQILREQGSVIRPNLKERCQNINQHPDVYVKDFQANFASLKTDTGNSNGKVFLDDGYNIKIWDEVFETLDKYRNLFVS